MSDKTHTNKLFKDKKFVSTAEGQKAMFYGDRYFDTPIKNTDLEIGEVGTDPVLDKKGNPAGALIAVPSGRVLVYDAEKAGLNKILIELESNRVKRS